MSGQQQPTPVDEQRLVELIAMGHVGPDDNVWRETMSEWLPVSHVPELASYAMPSASRTNHAAGFPQSDTIPSPRFTTGNMSPEYQRFVGKKAGAGVAALLLGTIGIHKFMLGLTTGGLTMLLLTLLVIPIPFLSVIAFVEGILYLTKTDEQFFRDYAVDRKQWF
jgi:TM2 domain-containing membrane protein YozV